MLDRSDYIQVRTELPTPVRTAEDMERGKGVGRVLVLEQHAEVDNAAGLVHLIGFSIVQFRKAGETPTGEESHDVRHRRTIQARREHTLQLPLVAVGIGLCLVL